MQRNLLSSFLFTTVVAGVVVSCGRADKAALSVPKDVAVVIHINAPSLSSKLSWQDIKATEWFKEIYKDASDSVARNLLDNPDNSGIDTKSDIVFFVKKQGKGGYFAVTGSIKDLATFEAFNKKVNSGAAITKSGDISLMKVQTKAALAYTDKRFIYIADAPMPNLGNMLSMGRSTYEEAFSFTADSLQVFGKQLLTLSGDDNLGNDDRFADLIKEPGDVHMWFNTGQYYGSLGGGMLSMLKLNAFLENNVSATTFNFDNGKMTMKSKQYYSKEMMDLIDKYPAGTVSEDVINRIPSKNVVAVLAGKYPPQGLKEFLKLIGVDGMINGYMGEVGYSLDEFVKANKGDLVLAVSDFELTTTGATTVPNLGGGEPLEIPGRTEPSVKVLFATSINDKPAFDKLVGIVQKTVPPDAGFMSKITYKLDNNWFAAGNSPEYVNAFITGGNNKQPFASRISGHAFGGYIDIQKAITGLGTGMKDSSDKASYDASLAMWQDAVMVSGGEKGGAVTSEAEINLVDKNTNSLKQLNQYIDKLAKIHLAKRKSYEDVNIDYAVPDTEAMVDTAVAIPAPPAPKKKH
jgi:hypothetical protein